MSKSGSSAKHFLFPFMTMENKKLKSTKQTTDNSKGILFVTIHINSIFIQEVVSMILRKIDYTQHLYHHIYHKYNLNHHYIPIIGII